MSEQLKCNSDSEWQESSVEDEWLSELLTDSDFRVPSVGECLPSCCIATNNDGLDDFLVIGEKYHVMGKMEKFGKEYYLVECDDERVKWVAASRLK